MLSAVNTEALNGLMADGILGLAPSTQKTKASLFIEELYNSRVIEKKVFSFSIQYNNQSVFTVGGYDANKYAPTGYTGSAITWNDLINTNYWSLNMVSVKFGDQDLILSSNVAIIDTGTSYLLMP